MEDITKLVELASGLVKLTTSSPFMVASLGVTALSMGGFTPRLGPLRAAGLALRSRFTRVIPQSIRPEAKELVALVANLQGEEFILVTGPKGIGKTCAVATALQRTAGVVFVPVHPAEATTEIQNRALAAIAGLRSVENRWVDPASNALRVAFCFEVFTLFRRRPVVVLQVHERTTGKPQAEISDAARSLAGTYRMRVIVDASDNSMDVAATVTSRCIHIPLAAMTREQIEAIPEFTRLHEQLVQRGLSDITWDILGGNPLEYRALMRVLAIAMGADPVYVAVEHILQQRLRFAEDHLRRLLVLAPAFRFVLKSFETEEWIYASCLLDATGNILELPSTSKALRSVGVGIHSRIYPANAAVSFFLRHRLNQGSFTTMDLHLDDIIRLAVAPTKLFAAN